MVRVFLMVMLVVFLGMFMGPLPIMLITLPIFVPVVIQLGFDPIWFAALFLVAIETGATSPPFGAALFVMKAVAPKGTTMGDIYRAALPFMPAKNSASCSMRRIMCGSRS